MKKTEFGYMTCSECGAQVKVMKSEKGGLSYRCLARKCDNTDYATDAMPEKKARWLNRIEKFDDAPAADPASPPPKPAKQPSSNPFFE